MVKTVRLMGVGTMFVLMAAGGWLACGDDTAAKPGADGGGTEGGAGDSTVATDAGSDGGSSSGADTGGGGPETGAMETGGDDGGGADGGAVEAGEAGALSCTTYCNAIMAACTGANAQYQTPAECLTACAFFPVGTVADTSGNTLGCRTYHSGLALTGPVPHCWHAGPFGFGLCGQQCDDFCLLTTSYCSPDAGYAGDAAPYASLSACTTACPGFTSIAGGDGGPAIDGGFFAMGPGGGNTLDCREYHLGNALTSTALQQAHCPHPAVVSAPCH
jgi:hypothetical protein